MNENTMDKYFRWHIPTESGIKEVRRLKINDKYTWLRAVRAAVAGDLPVTADATRSLPMIEYTVRGAGPFQDGTPTPTNPVEITGVGVKTANLFDENKALLQNWYDGAGWRVAQSFAFTSQFLKIGSATSITFKYSVDATNSEICFFDSNKSFISRITLSHVAETIPTNAEYFIVGLYSPNSFSYTPTIDDVINSKVMLYFGKEDKAFEPYGYKTEITNAGDNLCKELVSGISISSSNGSESLNQAYATSDYIPVDYSKYTYVNISGLDDSYSSFIAGYNKDKEYVGRSGGNKRTEVYMRDSSFINTPGQTTDKVVKYIRITQYGFTDVDNQKPNKLMVTESNENTYADFEPFHSETTPIYTPSPIFSDGYVSKTEMEDTEYTGWKTLIFTGDENNWHQWAASLTNVERYYYQFSDLANSEVLDQSKCSHLSYILGDTNNHHFRFSKNGNDYNQFVIYVDKSTITSVDDLKNWLKEEYSKGTPLTLVYPLASPTTTPTTLPDINLIKGINNLDSTSPIKPNFLGTYYGLDETSPTSSAMLTSNDEDFYTADDDAFEVK